MDKRKVAIELVKLAKELTGASFKIKKVAFVPDSDNMINPEVSIIGVMRKDGQLGILEDNIKSYKVAIKTAESELKKIPGVASVKKQHVTPNYSASLGNELEFIQFYDVELSLKDYDPEYEFDYSGIIKQLRKLGYKVHR